MARYAEERNRSRAPRFQTGVVRSVAATTIMVGAMLVLMIVIVLVITVVAFGRARGAAMAITIISTIKSTMGAAARGEK